MAYESTENGYARIKNVPNKNRNNPFLISDCGEPSALPGGQRSFSGTEVGFVTTHSCRNGYVDVANVVTVESTCLLGGNWSTVFINCSSMYELPSPTAYISILCYHVLSTFELRRAMHC